LVVVLPVNHISFVTAGSASVSEAHVLIAGRKNDPV
jgi:hypothetical protein